VGSGAALAGALNTYGIVLTELGRDQDALTVDREAVALYRQLHARYPGRYRDALATALRHLVIDLRTLNLDAEAEQVEREAAELAG
jgi:hypothetical protein